MVVLLFCSLPLTFLFGFDNDFFVQLPSSCTVFGEQHETVL